MNKSGHGSHTVSRMTAHLVWVTKYRYYVLKGDIQKRCRELLIQICDSEDVKILSGVESLDHVHMHIEYAPKKLISDIARATQRQNIENVEKRVSRIAKAVLGTAM
jgi:putative transposase